MALPQGLICTKRVYLGLSKVDFIEGCPHVRGGFMRGSTVLKMYAGDLISTVRPHMILRLSKYISASGAWQKNFHVP